MLQTLAAAGPLIQAGSNVFNSIQGVRQGNAAARSQEEANRLALLNFVLNNQRANNAEALNTLALGQSMRQSDAQQRMATEATVDAAGNRLSYVPGIGWTTTPSLRNSEFQALQDALDTRGFVVDNPQAQAEAVIAARQRMDARSDADAARAARGVGAETVEGLRGRMIAAGVAEADSGADALRNAIGISALRTGSGGETALANAARNAIADRRSAIARAELEAPMEYTRRRAARTSGNDDEIGAAMQRAQGAPMFRGQNRVDDVSVRSPAQLELMSRLQRAGGVNAVQVEAPRIGYRDDRTGIGVAGLGGSVDRFLTELGQLGRPRGTKQPAREPASMLEGMF